MGLQWEPRPFPATVSGIVDDDKDIVLALLIDCGFDIHTQQCVRLSRISTALMLKAKDFVEDFLHGVDQVLVTTLKGKNGPCRYTAEIVVIRDGEMVNLSDKLLEEGLAEEYK